ncbi:MAG: pantoate--beta-alanine ligase [Pseudohongiella sp.]|nr:pantoate--beta-alanine ligase [Pseudohongiella sp.]
MKICHQVSELRKLLGCYRRDGKSIALVPTMGNLHSGHVRLVEKAVGLADIVVSSIFVNPMQFGRNEDLDKYPRTPDADIEKLTAAGCGVLFAPPASEMYPLGLDEHTVVSVPAISDRHCGASRPGHFDGVATVVSKLFNIVQPDHAVFGLKDYQQFKVISKMNADLCFGIELTGVATERDANGLALSSRNGYLSAEEKQTALTIIQTLRQTAESIRNGERNYTALEQQAKTLFESRQMRPDYFTVCRADTLAPAVADDKNLVVLTAAYVGTTRLIDNIEVNL